MGSKSLKTVLLASGLMLVLGIVQARAMEHYRIGVLAKNGPVKAMKMWKATGEFLTSRLPGMSFEIVPLDFDQVDPSIRKGKIDFFLVNSSLFVTAKVKYGSDAIATMINSRQGKPLKAFGGVIFCSSEEGTIRHLSDLKGKTFMAVKKSSFGGWQMAYKELLDAGIDPFRDFAKLQFGGKHDNVVYSVLNGVVDAGTVRTDTLERMAASGEIDMEDFRIINLKNHPGFPFVCSTALYPEWPMAKVKHVSGKVASLVVGALKKIKAGDKAAKDARIVGWVDALDYGSVEALQKKLKVGAFE